MAKEKMNLYLLAIVAIVAVVGVVVLVLNAGTSSLSYSTDDLSGQAIKVGVGTAKTLVVVRSSTYSSVLGESYPCCDSDSTGCICSSEDCNDCKDVNRVLR